MLCQKLASLSRQKAELLKQIDDGKLDGITPEELHAEIDGYDEAINECKKHVLMHTAQREEFNLLVQFSKLSLQQGLPMELVTVLLVIDMAQNAETPCLSGDQMGNIYYMSPLLHLIFGVANLA